MGGLDGGETSKNVVFCEDARGRRKSSSHVLPRTVMTPAYNSRAFRGNVRDKR